MELRLRRLAALAALLLLAAQHAVGRGLPQAEVKSPHGKALWDKPVKNSKPIIGRSWIAAGFVKWIEAAGGRAVPIRYYHSEAELYRLFKSVNGIIFPGGLTDLWLDSPYVVAARKIWNWAKESNDNGDVFPIHGTCLGFQLLHILESNVSFTQLLVDTDAVEHASTLDWVEGARESAMWDGLDEDLFAKIADPTLNITMENHMFGLPPAHYDKWPVLRENFNILTTTKDRVGVEYVSTAEHKTYPFYATQWHPEKPPFEFGMATIPHSLDAIRVVQHLANVFIDTARRSSHAPESFEQELEMLIYNYKPWFTLKDSVMDGSYDGPDITYFFDNPMDEPSNGLGSTSFAGRVHGWNADAPIKGGQQNVLRRGGEDRWVGQERSNSA